MIRRMTRALVSFVMILAGAVVGVGATAGTAHADECYTWSRTLSEGASGADVTQLQIRVAGWVTSGERLSYDGVYGARTKAAVAKFQAAYGLGADGVAGPATFSKIYALQDADCTPVHFTYAEMNKCNSDWSGALGPGGHRQVQRAEDHVEAGGDAARAGRRADHRLQRLPFPVLQQCGGRGLGQPPHVR
ncbi:hypothetical protein M2169_002028 [Streptomyces sp. MJP52]|nr:hypothetical protein [Streptomyces sp. MJP52]